LGYLTKRDICDLFWCHVTFNFNLLTPKVACSCPVLQTTCANLHHKCFIRFANIPWQFAALLPMLSVAHIMPVLMLLSVVGVGNQNEMQKLSKAKSRMDVNMQLTINSFRPLFADNIFSWHLPDICPWHLLNSQFFQTSGYPVYYILTKTKRTNKLIRPRLTQYLPSGTFWLPWRDPRGIRHQNARCTVHDRPPSLW